MQLGPNDVVQDAQEELFHLMTILYTVVQIALDSKEDMEPTHTDLRMQGPHLRVLYVRPLTIYFFQSV